MEEINTTEGEEILGYKKKTLVSALILMLVAGSMFYIGAKYEKNKLSRLGLLKNKTEQSAKVKKQKKADAEMQKVEIKEFSMTSYYDATGKWFSLKEISVNKGDLVRIKVTNTKGTHDFTLDEYNIKKMTPLNEEIIIEFTADKAGEFEYYCSVPGHRQGGQVGKLIVKDASSEIVVPVSEDKK